MDSFNFFQILVSCNFLKMPNMKEACYSFFSKNLKTILKDSFYLDEASVNRALIPIV
jgi:hypothetical protein